MDLTTLRLEHPDLGTLGIDRAVGYVVQQFILGQAEVRTTEQPRSGADGMLDYTRWVGGRAATLLAQLYGHDEGSGSSYTCDELARLLGAYMRPDRRPVLVWQWDDDPLQRLEVSPRGFTPPGWVGDALRYPAVVCQFKAARGLIEAYDLSEVSIAASAGTAPAGRSYNLAFDRDYPGGGGSGRTDLTSFGTVPAEFVARIVGPCTEPIFGNETYDELMTFVGLTIADGHYLEIDTLARTVLYDGVVTDSRYANLDQATLTWPRIHPGVNTFRFTPTTSSAPSAAVVQWRDAYL